MKGGTTPKALDSIVDLVLAYRPKAKSKPARRRIRQSNRLAWGHRSRHCVHCGKVGPRVVKELNVRGVSPRVSCPDAGTWRKR